MLTQANQFGCNSIDSFNSKGFSQGLLESLMVPGSQALLLTTEIFGAAKFLLISLANDRALEVLPGDSVRAPTYNSTWAWQ